MNSFQDVLHTCGSLQLDEVFCDHDHVDLLLLGDSTCDFRLFLQCFISRRWNTNQEVNEQATPTCFRCLCRVW